MVDIKMKRWQILILILVIIVFKNQTIITNDPIKSAKIAAEKDIKGQVWLGCGCLFNILGVGMALITRVNLPPSDLLMGKDQHYVETFLKNYQKYVRQKRLNNAFLGCLASSVFWFIFFDNGGSVLIFGAEGF